MTNTTTNTTASMEGEVVTMTNINQAPQSTTEQYLAFLASEEGQALMAKAQQAPVVTVAPVEVPVQEVTVDGGITMEKVQEMIANGQIQVAQGQQQPMTDKGFFNLLGKLGHKVPQQPVVAPVAPAQPAETFTYEFVEITDLCLPKLSAEDKAKAIALANQIEALKVSIAKRSQEKIAISDTELADLSRLRAEFKRVTCESLVGQMRLAARGNKIKMQGHVAKAEEKSLQFVQDVESVSGDIIDGVVDLGIETLKFTGVAAKGVIGLASTATQGVIKAGFNIIK